MKYKIDINGVDDYIEKHELCDYRFKEFCIENKDVIFNDEDDYVDTICIESGGFVYGLRIRSCNNTVWYFIVGYTIKIYNESVEDKVNSIIKQVYNR